jgi:peptidoglycan/LPS O-acetylase OafA/YrhL
LANEFQFFLITPLLLTVLQRSPWRGFLLLTVLCIASACTTIYLSLTNHLTFPQPLDFSEAAWQK